MNNLIAIATSMAWEHLALMISLVLVALLELKTREVKLWMLQILPSLTLAFATYSWWMYSAATAFSSFYHILGVIVLLTVHSVGIVIGQGIEDENPIVDIQNKTVVVIGSKRPLVLAIICCAMMVFWEYCTAFYPDMAFCRLMLDLNLYFIAGLFMGRSNFYRASYARRVKAVQIFGN